MHKDCEYYVEQNDMCLAYYQLGFFNISEYEECVKNRLWGSDDE